MKKFFDGGKYFILSSFFISKVPYTDNEDVILNLSKTLCEDACNLSAEGNGQTSLEILRLAGNTEGSRIRHIVTIRTHDNSEQDCLIRHSALVRGIISCLHQYGYIADELSYNDYRHMQLSMNSGNVWALTKQDVVEYGIQGTYKSPSVVETIDWEKIYMALNGSGCALCIQIIPSLLTESERKAIINNVTTLSQAESGIIPNMRDQLVSASVERWQNYSKVIRRPFAEANILVSGNVPNTSLLADRIKQATGDTTFDLIKLQNYESYSIYNQPWKIACALKEIDNSCLRKWSSMEISHIFQFPSQGKYFVGVEGNPFSFVPETNLVSTKISRPSDKSIHLGKSVWTMQDVNLPLDLYSKHTAVFGKTSGGKTTFLKQNISSFYEAGVPVLIIEPVKREYRDHVYQFDNGKIFTVERPTTPLLINPFSVPNGVTLGEYKSSLLSAFKAAFSLPDPLPSVFERAISDAYLQHGWTDMCMNTQKGATSLDMADFIRVFKRVIDKSDYSNEVKGNIMSGGAFRLQSLLERCPKTFDTIHSTSVEDLLNGCTVLEMGSLEPEQKSLVSAITLITILAYLRATRESDHHLKNIILIDEAHALLDLGEGSTQEEKSLNSTMTQLMINVITEMSAYGVGVIFSDQSPSRIGSKMLDNVDNVISFRLSGEEAEMLGNHLGMTEKEKRVLPLMSTGEFVVKNHLLRSALAARTEFDSTKKCLEHVTDEMIANKQMEYMNTHVEEYRPYHSCNFAGCEKCNFNLRDEANKLAAQIFVGRQEQLKTPDGIAAHIVKIPNILANRVTTDESFNNLCRCVAIHLIRRCSADNNISLSASSVATLLGEMHFNKKPEG